MTTAGEQNLQRHWWVAGLLSFLAIGLGHVYAGRLRSAGVFLAVWLMLLALFHTALPSTFAGFSVLYLGLLALQPVVIGHAAVTAWRNPVVARQRFHHWAFYVLYAGVVFFILAGLVLGAFEAAGGPAAFGGYKPYRMTSVPMEPTLQRGDYVMVKSASAADPDMSGYVGHVVIYMSEHTYIHRMVAIGGDRIAMRGGKVVVNDRVLPREDLCTTPVSDRGAEAKLSVETNGAQKYVVQHSTAEGAEYTAFIAERDEETLEPDQFFVIGDSRDNSKDSRTSEPLRKEQLVGRALYVFWSDDWSRIGRSLSPDVPVVRADYCGHEPQP